MALVVLVVSFAIPMEVRGEDAVREASSGTSSSVDGDRLGGARLFFTLGERATGSEEAVPASPAARSVDDVSPERIAAVAVSGAGTRAGARAGTPDAARRKGLAARPRFQAVLRVGGRVRVIVNDRPCRSDGTAAGLLCASLPDDIRALTLEAGERRLLATFVDGRRRWIEIGMELSR